MPKASPIILSFSSGELSPLFDGRVDLEEYASGCRTLENFIPLIQGPAQRRGGTRFVREVKDSGDRTGSIKFQFNTEQAYFLEVGDQYIRFYTDHGIVMNGTNPLELATPWAAADLFDADGNFLLRSYVQSGDVMWICHAEGTYAPQKLTRTGALTWSIAEFEPDGGPFEDVDPDETVEVYADAATGTITLAASSAIFTSSYVGALFLLEQKATDDTEAWEAAKAVTANDVRRVDGRNYIALNSATTGTIVPSHTSGAAYDGDGGVQWQFQDAGRGWARITAVASSGTSATATVLSRIPDGAINSGNASKRWAFGAWSDAAGWPTHVTFFRERLTFLRATTREFWMSTAGDFGNFNGRDAGGLIVADAAISGEVTSDQANRIEWVVPSDRLIVGTAGGEFSIGEITTSEPLGPGNVKADPESAYGSRPVQPVTVGGNILFVQRSGRKLRDYGYTVQSDGYESSNLSVLAPHLVPKLKAFTALAYQQEPNSVIWAMRSDGKLMASTLNANQKRFGWHRHPMGGDGIVESIQSLPNPDGDADELWLIVRRTIDGSTVRYVEYLTAPWERDEDIIEAFYVDCGLTYDGKVNATLTPGTGANVRDTINVAFTAGSSVFLSGDVGKQIFYRYQLDEDDREDENDDGYRTARALITAYTSGTVVRGTILSPWPALTLIAANHWRRSASTITGLDHLEGETVDVLTDGATHPQRTVASGSITLQGASSYVQVGLPCPAKLKTMRLNAGAADGTAQGKVKRVHKATMRLQDTLGGRAGPDEDNLDDLDFRSGSDLMDEPPPVVSEDFEIRWPDGYTKDAYCMYVNDQPLPATVIAIMPQVVTQD